MKRTIILFFLSITLSCAGEAPRAVILTAEQAVARFQEARKADLKDLSEPQKKSVTAGSNAENLSVRRMLPRDYQPPRSDHSIKVDAAWIIVGTLAAVAECKNETWRLDYSFGLGNSMVVYLDAVSGKVLFIHSIPEG